MRPIVTVGDNPLCMVSNRPTVRRRMAAGSGPSGAMLESPSVYSPLRTMLHRLPATFGSRGDRGVVTSLPSRAQAAFRSNSARAALMPRRKAILRVTQCAVRCSGVPMAVLNCCSIRAVVAMNGSGSICSRSRICGASPGGSGRNVSP